MLAARSLRFVLLPACLVDLGFGERFPDHFLNSHARSRVSPVLRSSRIEEVWLWLSLALRILAQCEFDSGLGSLEGHVLCMFARAQLDALGLSADCVGTAVQDVRDR